MRVLPKDSCAAQDPLRERAGPGQHPELSDARPDPVLRLVRALARLAARELLLARAGVSVAIVSSGSGWPAGGLR